MPRKKTATNAIASLANFDSSQDSLDDSTDLSAAQQSSNDPLAHSSTVINTPRPSLKAKRSLVWRYFTPCNDTLDAECMLCTTSVARTSTSTSNLLYHIQAHHPNEYLIVNKAKEPKSIESVPRLPLSSNRSAELTKLAAELVIENSLPLSIIESPQLRAIFQQAEPSYSLPKRKYFVNNVLHEMYVERRKKVQKELEDAIGVCLTTDIWTSQVNQAYMTITAHVVDSKEAILKCYVLETTEFTGNHTAERIVDRLECICIEWGILDKVACLVSDTCNVMRKVGKDFVKGWFGCVDHIINLCVEDTVRKSDDIKKALGGVRRIVLFVRESHLAKETLHRYQTSFGRQERQLIYDVITRWNSTFYMLKRFVEEKLPISACLNEPSFKKTLVKAKLAENIDWHTLEQLVLVLEPLESATRKLAADSKPTISIVLAIIATLITSLEGRISDSPIITRLKHCLRDSIEERFNDLFSDKIVLIATALDPRWKNFTFLHSSSYQSHLETLNSLTKLHAFDARLLAYTHLHNEYISYCSSAANISQSNSQHVVTSNSTSDFFDIMVTSQSTTTCSNTDTEFVMYENEKEIFRDEDVLGWWRTNTNKYPNLSKLAYKFLCIVATSVPSERMFSTSGYLTSDRRSRLKPDNANMLLFLHKNS